MSREEVDARFSATATCFPSCVRHHAIRSLVRLAPASAEGKLSGNVRVGNADVELFKQFPHRHAQRAVDGDTKCAEFVMLADQADRMVKVRVAHIGHGDQQMVTQVEYVLGHGYSGSCWLLSVENAAVENPRAGDVELIPLAANFFGECGGKSIRV